MVKLVDKKVNYSSEPNTWLATIAADTKEEVGPSMEIVGLPKNVKLEMLSSIMTPDGDIAFLDSSGNWNWVE